MVTRENIKKKYALISVFDKSKLGFLCKHLTHYKFRFISTGSTCEGGDGRVKSLNQNIWPILFLRNNKKHMKEFQK